MAKEYDRLSAVRILGFALSLLEALPEAITVGFRLEIYKMNLLLRKTQIFHQYSEIQTNSHNLMMRIKDKHLQ
jgi:hypothetical protein